MACTRNKYTRSIPATELATLRERAAMAEAAQEEKAKFAFTCANLRARLEQAGKERDELRKDAERLQKDAERMQKALSEIAEWTDRYTSPGHPIGTVARAAIAAEEEKE
jgi:chromosome segregation ATPase